MKHDLTTSQRERQNVLNNKYALSEAERHLALGGINYVGEFVFTKQQVSQIFEVSESTIEKYLATYLEELELNGYQVLQGKKLKEFKELNLGTVNTYGTKTTILGLFSFRTVLNLAMLLTESERARAMRSRILDIVLDVVNERAGGHIKFINQRDEDYLTSAIQEESYRKRFTDALDNFVDGNKWIYGQFTNLIYQSIFQENATEYKKILNLTKNDKIKDTLYSEILDLISSYESGFAHELELAFNYKGSKLSQAEAKDIFSKMSQHPAYTPLIISARTKMASRDLCFRDAFHEKLKSYIKSVPEVDFDRFLGEKSKSLEERLSEPETLAVLKRLKDR